MNINPQFNGRIGGIYTAALPLMSSPEAAPTGAKWDTALFVQVIKLAYPASTAWYVTQVSGVPQRTVEKHLAQMSKPSADHIIAYFRAGELGKLLRIAMIGDGHGDNAAKVISGRSA